MMGGNAWEIRTVSTALYNGDDPLLKLEVIGVIHPTIQAKKRYDLEQMRHSAYQNIVNRSTHPDELQEMSQC